MEHTIEASPHALAQGSPLSMASEPLHLCAAAAAENPVRDMYIFMGHVWGGGGGGGGSKY